MKMYQLKERALMLLIFALMKQYFLEEEIEPKKINTNKLNNVYDIKIINLFKKIEKLNKTFINKETSDFLDMKLKKINDKLDYNCHLLSIFLLLLYFYLNTDTKKDFILNELSKDDIKNIFKEKLDINNCEINKAKELFLSIYNEKEGYICFLEASNKFPFNLKE